MSDDYTLNTTDRAPGAIIIDGHRYLRVGITRSAQRAVNQKIRDIRRIEKEGQAAEDAEDFTRVDELQDAAAECIIDVLGALLTSENGSEPAAIYLKKAWAEDRLQFDQHLYPLMEVLLAEMKAPVPPA